MREIPRFKKKLGKQMIYRLCIRILMPILVLQALSEGGQINSASNYAQTDCIYTYILKKFMPSSTGYIHTNLHTLLTVYGRRV